jgi:flagellar basal body-associated protein FliL
MVRLCRPWVQTGMHASLDQVRDTTIDTLGVARSRASDLVTTGTERLVDSIDRGVEGLEGRIVQVADLVPALSIEVDRHRRSRRWPLLVLAAILVIAGLGIARRMRAKKDRDNEDQAVESERIVPEANPTVAV